MGLGIESYGYKFISHDKKYFLEIEVETPIAKTKLNDLVQKILSQEIANPQFLKSPPQEN